MRSKGFFWLASRLDKIGVWSQAGRVARLDFGGFWWAAVPRDCWPDSPVVEAEIKRKWDPEVGDCRQELVFIGIGMNENAISESLEKCLLTEEELNQGIEAWNGFKDPFPKWSLTVEEALQELH